MTNSKNVTLALAALACLCGAFAVPRIFMAEAIRSKAEADRMMAELEVARANKEKAKHEYEVVKAAAEKAKFDADKAKFELEKTNRDREIAEETRKRAEQRFAVEEKMKLEREEQERLKAFKKYMDESWELKKAAVSSPSHLHKFADKSIPHYPKPTKKPDIPSHVIDTLLHERNRVLGIVYDFRFGEKKMRDEFTTWDRLKDSLNQMNSKLGLAPDDYRFLSDYPPAS